MCSRCRGLLFSRWRSLWSDWRLNSIWQQIFSFRSWKYIRLFRCCDCCQSCVSCMQFGVRCVWSSLCGCSRRSHTVDENLHSLSCFSKSYLRLKMKCVFFLNKIFIFRNDSFYQCFRFARIVIQSFHQKWFIIFLMISERFAFSLSCCLLTAIETISLQSNWKKYLNKNIQHINKLVSNGDSNPDNCFGHLKFCDSLEIQSISWTQQCFASWIRRIWNWNPFILFWNTEYFHSIEWV